MRLVEGVARVQALGVRASGEGLYSVLYGGCFEKMPSSSFWHQSAACRAGGRSLGYALPAIISV